jgi:archaetidylinositol phosphate synthase
MSAGSVVIGRQTGFVNAVRLNRSFTAAAEKRLLVWMAERAPAWVSSDGLTLLGFGAQIGAGACYAMARFDRRWLALGIWCIVLNWLGDSLDGTLARVRQQPRPRYGFYVDHMVDAFGSIALMTGLGLSGLVHWPVAIAMLIGFLLLASESFLATYTLGRFEMSQGMFGPTEIRLLLIAGNIAVMHSPFATIAGHRWLLFDIGGVLGAAGMLALATWVTLRHTGELYRQEPLAKCPRTTEL